MTVNVGTPCPRNDGGVIDETGFCDRCGMAPESEPRPHVVSLQYTGRAGWSGGEWGATVVELPERQGSDEPPLVEAPAEQDDLCPGDVVDGKYEVVGCLGAGGFGRVYLARHLRLNGIWVVLKGVRAAAGRYAREALETERQFLTSVDHPHIVRIFDFVDHSGPDAGTPRDYIGEEDFGGSPLDTTPMAADQVLEVGLRILAALDYLHRHGWLYCDIKPANVLWGDRIKLIDLGAARRIGDRDTPIAYTPHYGIDRQEIRAD